MKRAHKTPKNIEGYIPWSCSEKEIKMKLKLPHQTIDLDLELPLDERIPVINNILQTNIEFHNSTMTIEEYFHETWGNESTKICLDIIGYYLTKERQDLSILSQDREKELSVGSARHVTFSSMGYENQVNVGAIDPDDYEY